MKKLQRQLLAFLLTLIFAIPNSIDASAALNQPAVEITANDTKEVTTDVNEVISGNVTTKNSLKTITYTAVSEANNGEAYAEDVEATVSGSQWSIDDLTLMPGNNTITITATTENGKTDSETVEINYDMGSVADVETVIETQEGTICADNQLMVMFQSDVSKERIDEIIDSVDGKIIGNIYVLDEYQIQVKSTDYNGLNDICQKLESYNEVIFAELNSAMETNDVVTPNDPWGNSQDWNEEVPNGYNWGVEAIQAPSAWQYNDLLTECKVGVIDNGFQTDHPDLNVNFASQYMKNYNTSHSHGTHVAGTIGATANNGIGVTGVNWKAKIYGGSCADEDMTSLYTSQITYNLAELVQCGSKVINGSFGLSATISRTDEMVLAQGTNAAQQMAKLLSIGYDFIFVQSAGNSDCNARYNGTFCSVEANTPVSVSGITIQDILNRKIVVASVANAGNGTYTLSSSSNWGENVDIAAPGDNIYSTEWNSGYACKSGTSMAAPHVTGVVSLVWSANPDLTAPQVKEIVVNSTRGTIAARNASDTVSQYKLVNAKISVEKAILSGTLKVSTSNSVDLNRAADVTLTAEMLNDASDYSYRFGTIFNGKEYTFSNGYQKENSIHANFLTAISKDNKPSADAIGTHTLFVDVKSSSMSTISRLTLSDFEIRGTKVTELYALQSSPQVAGGAITLKSRVEDQYYSSTLNTYTFTVSKDGNSEVISDMADCYTSTWKPEEPGTYTISYSVKDALGQEASAQMKYTILPKETAIVFYNNDSWDSAYIHYKMGNGAWTTTPGKAMTAVSIKGYGWVYFLDLGKENNATVCFNNGNNSWDNNGNKNYTVTKGVNSIGGDDLTLHLSNIEGTSSKQNPCCKVKLSGGIAPYSYNYEIINKTSGKTTVSSISETSYYADFNVYHNMRQSGEYTFKIKITDAYGQTVTGSKDFTLKPFRISDITTSVASPQLPNTEITLTAQYENAFIYKYGLTSYWTITNKTTGSVQEYVTYISNGLKWTPTETGEYEIFVSISDSNAENATYTINYTIADEILNQATIYYNNDSFSTAYIHYQTGNGSWTTLPGVKMAATSERSGYSWKYIIDLGDEENATLCFNNGSGSWDSNNNANYTVSAGTYGIKNGTITKLSSVITPTATPTATAAPTATVAPTVTVAPTTTAAPTAAATPTVTPVPKKATIYYSNSSWDKAYIHYCINNGNWTTVPGIQMETSNDVNGYTWKYEIDLSNKKADSTITICFNNGNNSWDSHNGNNYTIGAGAYGIKNGTIEKLNLGLSVSLDVKGEKGSAKAYTTVTNGVEPYTYTYSYTKNGVFADSKTTSEKEFSLSCRTSGTYKVEVTVTDAEGNTATASDTLILEPLTIKNITTNVASPQKTGAEITFTAAIANELAENTAASRTWKVIKNNKTVYEYSSKDNSMKWTALEEGTYTVTCSLTDASGESASKSIQYIINDASNTVTIYYNTSWNTAYIHYCIAGRSWTELPGIAMTATTEKNGYTYKVIIDLEDANAIQVCFNNGSGSWDSKNGNNYNLSSGVYGISNGNIISLE